MNAKAHHDGEIIQRKTFKATRKENQKEEQSGRVRREREGFPQARIPHASRRGNGLSAAFSPACIPRQQGLLEP